jgi:hypothetical protein
MSLTHTLLGWRTNQLTATEVLAETIVLHSLCENCTTYFLQWKALEWARDWGEGRSQEWQYSSCLCSVAQLVTSQRQCHFCTLILAALDRSPFTKREKVLDMNVYLRFQDNGDKTLAVNVLYASKQPKSDEEGRICGDFVLDCYLCMSYALFLSPSRLGNLTQYPASKQGAFTTHFTTPKVPLHARDNLSTAKRWIETCLIDHTTCHAFQVTTTDPSQRPTRVLEITGPTTVKLRCNMSNTPYNYLALSHMWGVHHKDQVRLLEDKLLAFQTSIPWPALSDIYHDAIRTARALGYRFLWIDSLCIVQDSASDWAYEAQRMATVYGNCDANLAYLFPPGSPPQQRDDPRIWAPCVLRTATALEAGVYMRHPTSSWIQDFPPAGQDWMVQRQWPLFGRAWTYQEYLLSPRTLLCGHKNLMFQCSAVFFDELMGPIAEGVKARPSHGRHMCKARYFPEVVGKRPKGGYAALRFVLDWMNVVSEYRARRLSYAADRVVAFAGIASAYGKLEGMTYLAGLWLECLPLCLMWRVEKKAPALLRSQYPSVCRRGEDVVYTDAIEEPGVAAAPSWCWFSAPIYRSYAVSLLFTDDESGVLVRSEREPERSSVTTIFSAEPTWYRFASGQENEYPNSNAFVDFAGLQISLTLLTWPVSNDMPADLASQIGTIQAASTLEKDIDWDPRFTYHPDIPAPTTTRYPSPPRNGTFALLCESQIVHIAGAPIQRRLAGLVVVPCTEQGTWKRVGVWHLKVRIQGVNVEVGHVSDVAARWKGYSLTRSWKVSSLVLV